MTTKTDPLNTILEDLPIAQRSVNIFLEYLCSQSGRFVNFKEVGESFDVSKQRVHQVVERFCTALDLKHKHDGILELLLTPVTQTLAKYKGAIRIEQYVEDNRETTGLGDVELRRYLRFAEIISKQIEINKDMDLFWESRSRCLKCRSFKDEFITYKEITPEILEQIDRICILQNCPIRGERQFELGQLTYYSPFHRASREHRQNESVVVQKSAKASFDDLIHNSRVGLNNTQVDLLNFMCRNECKVSQTKLAAYCGIKKIDLNPSILEINAEFFKATGGELIAFNSAEECWEMDDAILVLSTYNNTSESGHEYAQEAKIESSPPEDTPAEDNQERSILELHMEMLENTLSNSNQSYKFYWAESLFYFMKQKRTCVSFHEMAASMVAHAWDDVLNKKLSFKHNDLIPDIVKNIFRSSTISLHENGDSLYYALLKLIANQDVKRLMRYVPDHFINSYSSLFISDSSTMRLYVIKKENIYISSNKLDNGCIRELVRYVEFTKAKYLNDICNQ